MYRVQDWAEVHRLWRREGWAKTDIAEKLRLSRNTVDRLLSLAAPPKYRRPRRASKLDPQKAIIVKMLDKDSDVAATVILERARRQGYGGGSPEGLPGWGPSLLRGGEVPVSAPAICRGRSFRRTGGRRGSGYR